MTTTDPPPPNKFLNLTDLTNPYRLETSDNPSTVLITELLNVDNFCTWSRSIQRALRAKNKLGFLNGTLTKPSDSNDPLFGLWERCNDMVVSWLQNSISIPLRSSVAVVDDAHQIWSELEERFSPQNGPRIYELKKQLANLNQDDDSVNTYYSKLKSIWDGLSVYDPLPVCSCGSTKLVSERYQRDCVLQFLMGLHESFGNVRDQIMLIDPLPPVTKVFSYIQQQKRHRAITSSNPANDTIALATRKYTPNPSPNQGKRDKLYCSHCKITGHTLVNCFKSGNATAPVCTHCEMTGHVVDHCYKLHGYPPGHKLHKPKANVAALGTSIVTSEPSLSLTKEQYQDLIALLHSKDSSPSANKIQTVISSNPHSSPVAGISLCLSTSYSMTPWIIDTGAIDHMICHPSLFKTITSSISQSVKLPNGELATVTHIGTVQGLSSWTTIGKGSMEHGLYHLLIDLVSPQALTNTLSQNFHSQNHISAAVQPTDSAHDLWHYR
ncbi:hypothetical protein F2P56_013181 [Juglans regia]|uniref:Retrotransposon Copia-like N-terminal domain-containing protein n=1 Tax=Juglans regia TaxID=51240 RepID=A0A834CXX9_JUGRE|nr:hypothetical protein F2P56_013181 [Juglans regia]